MAELPPITGVVSLPEAVAPPVMSTLIAGGALLMVSSPLVVSLTALLRVTVATTS